MPPRDPTSTHLNGLPSNQVPNKDASRGIPVWLIRQTYSNDPFFQCVTRARDNRDIKCTKDSRYGSDEPEERGRP